MEDLTDSRTTPWLECHATLLRPGERRLLIPMSSHLGRGGIAGQSMTTPKRSAVRIRSKTVIEAFARLSERTLASLVIAVLANPVIRPKASLLDNGDGRPTQGWALRAWPSSAVDAGMVLINSYFRTVLGTHFGAIKGSGQAGEHCEETLCEFTQPKNIWMPWGRGIVPQRRAVKDSYLAV